ncbi:MAG: NAD(P)H-binding protein [Candidatus Saccharimonadales bacterium]
MKIAVIGANGKTGQILVNEAVQRGHSVRAGVFRTNTFKTSDYIESVHCDAMKLEDVTKLIKGCDAVVSLIGHIPNSPAFVQTTAISNVLSAMKAQRITRIVSLTGTGVRMPGDKPSLIDHVLNVGIKIIDGDRIRDGIAHADVLRESDADWTIIRVLKLTDLPMHSYTLTSGGPARTLVSRAAVSEAIIEVLTQKTHYKEAPVIS